MYILPMQSSWYLALLLNVFCSSGVHLRYSERANPIRKVVTILQDMQQETTAEGEKEEELMEKFNCYCDRNEKQMTSDISTGETRTEELRGRVEQESAEKSQLEQELAQHKGDRQQALADMEKATSLRDKEREAWKQSNAEALSNMDAIKKAVSALEAGMAEPALLQSGSSTALVAIKNLLESSSSLASISDYDRKSLQSFLEMKGSDQTGQIVGILKQMGEDMSKDQAEGQAEEEAREASFAELKTAKEKEVKANTEAVEAKTVRAGALAVGVVNSQNDLEDTTNTIDETRVMLKELTASCTTKNKEWEERKATRAQELEAISETIKILNDDDALNVFQNTLPSESAPAQAVSPALLQESMVIDKRARAQRILRRLPTRGANNAISSAVQNSKLVLLQSAVRGASGKADFSKIASMIDGMVEVLLKEQKDDQAQRQWCTNEIDQTGDNMKDKHRSLDRVNATMEEGEAEIEASSGEIQEAHDETTRLDKAVVEATEQRKEEHAEFVQTQSELTAAQQLLGKAKNRLNKFYNPSLYKAPEAQQMTDSERIEQNMGLDVPTAPPKMIAGTSQTVSLVQVRVHSQTSLRGLAALKLRESQPETFDGPYQSEGPKSGGVTALIDMLVNDLAKDQQQGQNDEKVSQRDYETLMGQLKSSREELSQAITDKEAAKSSLQIRMEEAKDEKRNDQKAILDMGQYMSELHGSCDFLLQNFEIRKEARTSEIEGLKQAKAVLSGADYS